jgi:hypothetical protein
MWTATATFLLVVGLEALDFAVCAQATHRSQGQTPSFDRNTAVNLGGGLLYPGAVNPEGLAGQVFLAVDRSGGATNNNIYMLCSVLPAGRSTTDVMFVRSTDGGLTFSAPHPINDDGLNTKWHWFGTFSVAPNGRLDACLERLAQLCCQQHRLAIILLLEH